MSRRLLILLSVLALALAALSPVAAGAQTTDDGTTFTSGGDYTIITLTGKSAAYEDGTKTNGRFDPTSKGYQQALQRLERQHARFAASLAKTAPDAEIVEHFYITANAVAIKLNGSSKAAVSKIAGVEHAATSNLYQLDMNESVDLIRASEVWGDLGGRADAGEGIKVGIIDSGVDPTHPFFSCKDVEFGGVYASGVGILPGVPALPAWFGPGYEPGPGDPFYFASSHGTHVAGTVAGCVTDIGAEHTPWGGTTISGVAPGATLVDYNVFPFYGAGMVAYGGSAFSHDIAAAIEDAVEDGVHVINMSLGGTVNGPHDFLAEASNAAVEAGVVVVTSAGNEGPGPYTVGSPGSAEKVIAVGATTNTRGMGVLIEVDGGGPVYNAVPSQFPDFDGSLQTIVDWSGDDNEACSASGAGDHTGEVVVIARGSCTFSQKVQNAKDAGAEGAIIYTYPGLAPIGMATSTGYDNDLPAVMVSRVDGEALELGVDAVITAPTVVPEPENLIAGFSSRGPVPFTGAVKPDVLATGVNVLSSTTIFNAFGVTGSGWELFNGTSMASPHVAGAAALLLDWNGGLTAAEVKSALASTASDLGYEVWTQGAGLLDMVNAFAADTYFAPSNASFGTWQGKKPVNASVDIAITGAGGCSVGDIDGDYVDASVNGDTLTVDYSGGRDVGTGMHSGTVSVECGGQTYTVPWGVVVNR